MQSYTLGFPNDFNKHVKINRFKTFPLDKYCEIEGNNRTNIVAQRLLFLITQRCKKESLFYFFQINTRKL